jgi:sugar phosphate isomerase/epimerase
MAMAHAAGRFACLTTVVPGRSFTEQCGFLAAAGCDGLETIVFPETDLSRWQAEVRGGAEGAGLQVAAVILGGLALYRAGQSAWVGEAMHAVAELGAGVLITPEYRAQDPLPLFPPYVDPPAQERSRVEAALSEISEAATRLSLPVLLEPLTQFESRFWRDVSTVRNVCETLNNSWIGLALDFHNMNITEASIPASIVAAGRWVRHVHLADSNRRLPGAGHIDFRAGLAALQAIGYDGWYSLECAVDGEFVSAVRRTRAFLGV